MRQLPAVPQGMRVFLWVGSSSVSEWVVPIVAQDYDWAAEAAIQERVRCGNTLEEAQRRFEDDDDLIDITEIGDAIIASDPPRPECDDCGDRVELQAGLCSDCSKNRESAQA